jgi:hypothetical protein
VINGSDRKVLSNTTVGKTTPPIASVGMLVYRIIQLNIYIFLLKFIDKITSFIL